MITVKQFLDEGIGRALERERCNDSRIYLYHVNDSWSAVEKSAYFLSRLVACDVISLLVKASDRVPDGQILLASVSDTQLDRAKKNCSVMKPDSDHIILKPMMVPGHFAEWRQESIIEDPDEDDIEED